MYMILGWWTYEAIQKAKSLFPVFKDNLRSHVCMMMRHDKKLDRRLLLMGIMYGFIFAFRERGSLMALDYDCSEAKRVLQYEDYQYCCLDGFRSICISDLQIGIKEGYSISSLLFQNNID